MGFVIQNRHSITTCRIFGSTITRNEDILQDVEEARKTAERTNGCGAEGQLRDYPSQRSRISKGVS